MEARSKHEPLFTRRGALAMGAAVLSTAALVGIKETFAQGCLGIAGSGSAMPPAVVAAAERYLAERSSKLVATDLTGTSFTKIKSMVKRGLPVMVWSTIDAETPVYTSLRTDVEGYPIRGIGTSTAWCCTASMATMPWRATPLKGWSAATSHGSRSSIVPAG